MTTEARRTQRGAGVLDDSDAIMGHRGSDGPHVVVVRPGAKRVPPPLPHVVRHSPTGLEWGYGGSGPADLALSILHACCGRETAHGLYEAFKRAVVAPLPRDAWELNVGWVRQWARRRLEEDGR